MAIKGSKDSDYSQVSNKNLVKKFHLVVGAHGQVTWVKMVKNHPTHDITHKKLKSKTLQFFHCNLEDLPHHLSIWTAF